MPATGSSRQLLKTTGTNSAVPNRCTSRRAASRRPAATPARSSELFPAPLWPYTRVSRADLRLATMRSRSLSRPKKKGGVSFGEVREALVGPRSPGDVGVLCQERSASQVSKAFLSWTR